MLFAGDLAERRDLDPAWVRAVIGRASFLPQVPRLMLPAPRGTSKNWRAYRARFVEPVRIRAGVRFWNDNAAALRHAQKLLQLAAKVGAALGRARVGVRKIKGQCGRRGQSPPPSAPSSMA